MRQKGRIRQRQKEWSGHGCIVLDPWHPDTPIQLPFEAWTPWKWRDLHFFFIISLMRTILKSLLALIQYRPCFVFCLALWPRDTWELCLPTRVQTRNPLTEDWVLTPGPPGKSSVQFSSVAQSCPTLCNPVDRSTPGLPSIASPAVYSNSCPWNRWFHPTFSSSPQSFPASGSFPMSQLFASGGQRIGVSATTWVFPMNTQDWFHLGWTGWISLQSRGLSENLLQHHSSKPSIGISLLKAIWASINCWKIKHK